MAGTLDFNGATGFFGHAILTMDSKFRIVIPPSIIEEFNEKVFLHLNPKNKTLIGTNKPIYEVFDNLSLLMTAPYMSEGEIDKDRRIIITKEVADAIELEKKGKFVMAGCSNHIIIQSLATWKKNSSAYGEYAERMIESTPVQP